MMFLFPTCGHVEAAKTLVPIFLEWPMVLSTQKLPRAVELASQAFCKLPSSPQIGPV